jgi:hypothetical protein
MLRASWEDEAVSARLLSDLTRERVRIYSEELYPYYRLQRDPAADSGEGVLTVSVELAEEWVHAILAWETVQAQLRALYDSTVGKDPT